MSFPSWNSRGCNNEQFSKFPVTFITGIDWDVFYSTLVFTVKYVSPVSIRKSMKYSLNVKVTWGTWREIGIGCLKSRGAPGPRHSSSEWSSLSNIAEAHNFLLFFYLFFNLEQSFSPVPFLLSHFVPSPVWLTSFSVTCFPRIQGCCQKWYSLFHLLLSMFSAVEQFKNNIYQLRRVHAKCTMSHL